VYSFDLIPRNFWWLNTNKLSNDYFVASKTGITPSAGPCLATHFKFGPYESYGVLINTKTNEIRWREMATILIWQLDKFMRKNTLGGYNFQAVNEFRKRRLI